MEAKKIVIILGMRGIRLADHLFGWSQKKGIEVNHCLLLMSVCLQTAQIFS